MKLLEIKDLYVDYVSENSVTGRQQLIHALNGVDLEVQRGEIFAIAGESGCGKSTLAKAVMKLIPVKKGSILCKGMDVANLERKCFKEYYQKVQMIFQNPYSSLNPKMKIGKILREPLEINTKYTKKQIEDCIYNVLGQVGLDKSVLDLYPHEFSGGQRQRIAIARALILNPEIIIADEPVSALDVSIQAQIINLLKSLKDNFNLTFLFISHDLSVIRYISDRIAVMYLGEIVEIGATEDIFQHPKHPYTRALLSSVPELNPQSQKDTITLKGELPSPDNIPTGCKFNTRCPYAMDICRCEVPQETEFENSHCCKCFLYDEKSVV